MDRGSRKPPEPKREGIAPLSFGIVVAVMIILAVLVILFMILYFRRNGNLIDPSKCPPVVSGLVASPDTQINTLASNCGTQADCTFTVSSLEQAATLCSSLSGSKCVAFTLTPIALTNSYTMKISSSTGTSTLVGSDTYVPIA